MGGFNRFCRYLFHWHCCLFRGRLLLTQLLLHLGNFGLCLIHFFDLAILHSTCSLNWLTLLNFFHGCYFFLLHLLQLFIQHHFLIPGLLLLFRYAKQLPILSTHWKLALLRQLIVQEGCIGAVLLKLLLAALGLIVVEVVRSLWKLVMVERVLVFIMAFWLVLSFAALEQLLQL